MQTYLTLPGLAIMAALTADANQGSNTGKAPPDVPSPLYRIPVRTLDGRETTLAGYRGKVLLIVNVASRCGFTGQYEGLQALFDRLRGRGFVVLGFPANDFLGQEPGTNEDIRQFCTLNYGVTFPMFAKLSVKGKNQHPLYAFLTGAETNPKFAGRITWNFNKFLVGRDGRVIGRFGSRVKPESPELTQAIEAALNASPQP